MQHRVIHGDCLEQLRTLCRDGVMVDSVVTDPPYHLTSIVQRFSATSLTSEGTNETRAMARSDAMSRLSRGFMGQEWDGGDVAFRPDTWRRVYDVMKPGAHLVAFAATKGYHRMACAIEDAGFEIRDMLAWLYGTGFPKSENLKGEWDGWGSGLKPAIEPIVFAQKPISEGSIAANVARWGVGALHIDASRLHADDAQGGTYKVKRLAPGAEVNRTGAWKQAADFIGEQKPGRWPANVCHDGSEEVLEAFAKYGERGAIAPVHSRSSDKFRSTYGQFKGNVDEAGATFQGDSGSAARFFYSSKATQGERVFECNVCGDHRLGKLKCGHDDYRTHPTVKPPSLVSWLIELVTPKGGLVLDPFSGTGTTAFAARVAGMQSLSIEMSEHHVRDIGVRLGLDVTELVNASVSAFPVAPDADGQETLL